MKVVVGISGGVDSSTAALLLQEQGHQVEALFMKNWNDTDGNGSCMWEGDVEDAMRVCDRLQIPLNTVDLSDEYWKSVFSNFIREYRSGRTPNPDVLCNQEIKFSAFLDQAVSMGSERIATGHYARVEKHRDGFRLRKGIDLNKDQSYFLCRLSQSQLAMSLFPLGDRHKPDIRKLAREAGLVTHAKPDSTGICFVGEKPFREFLSRYIPRQSGEIRTLDERVIGEHEGAWFYTLGQRRGLGIGGLRSQTNEPWYVVNKDIGTNILYVAQGHDHPLLYSHGLIASDWHWIAGHPPELPLKCMVKTRYRQDDQECEVELNEPESLRIRFTEPQRAVAPGQFAVLYKGDDCLGGGVIESTWR